MQSIGATTPTANGAKEFTRGSPGSGVPATRITPEWLNTVQRELIGLVTGASLAPDPQNDAQLLQAVKNLANEVAAASGLGVTQFLDGAIKSLSVTKFIAAGPDTTDRPAGVSYGTGVHISYPEGKYAFDLLASLSSDAFFVRKLGADGTGTWRTLLHDGNFNPSTKADKATTLAGYGITDAYTQAQLDSALNSKATKATTLDGYGITDTYTKSQINSSLNAKYSTSGGLISGAVTVQVSGQDITTAGLSVNNPTPGGFSVLRLGTTASAATWIHTPNSNLLSARNAASGATDIDVGTVTSNGSLCHTATSFMKPVSGQFVVLSGNATLPAGGTWAYFAGAYNGSGAVLGGTAGVAAGGTVVGQNSNCVGFAWRIQ